MSGDENKFLSEPAWIRETCFPLDHMLCFVRENLFSTPKNFSIFQFDSGGDQYTSLSYHCHVMCKSQVWLRKKISCRVFFLSCLLLLTKSESDLKFNLFLQCSTFCMVKLLLSVAFNWKKVLRFFAAQVEIPKEFAKDMFKGLRRDDLIR